MSDFGAGAAVDQSVRGGADAVGAGFGVDCSRGRVGAGCSSELSSCDKPVGDGPVARIGERLRSSC